MKGIDCTSNITEQIGKKLKDSGIQFVCRYLVPEKYRWKRLIPDEVDVLTNLGLYIVSVFETTADRTKGGYEAGLADGLDMMQEAQIVNQPKGSAIYFAVDYDALRFDYDAIEAYLNAAASQLPDYNVGVYGPFHVVEEMVKRKACRHFWQTYAWSYGKLSKYANIYQYKNGSTLAGIVCDLNNSYGNEGGWNLMSELTWKEIIKKVSSNPDEWLKAIDTAVNASKADGNMGDFEIFKFLPELIEKIYKNR